MQKQQLYLNLNNTTGTTQTMSLFNQTLPSGNANSSNVDGNPAAQNAFGADMTSELAIAAASPFPLNTVVVFYRPVTGGDWQVATAVNNPSFTNISEVITALNSLNLGTFTLVSGNAITITSSVYSFLSIAISAQLPGSAYTDLTFSSFGSLIYSPGFNAATGAGTVSQIDTLNPFWINPFTLTEGAMNRNAMSNGTIQGGGGGYGFHVNINSAVNKTVYMGIGASHDQATPIVILKNDASASAQSILTMDAAAMQASITSQLGIIYDTPDPTYVFWNIYPVSLVIGNNFFQFFNNNDSLVNPYFLGVEIYDNTASEIAAATTYADLTMLFQSSNYAGQNLY